MIFSALLSPCLAAPAPETFWIKVAQFEPSETGTAEFPAKCYYEESIRGLPNAIVGTAFEWTFLSISHTFDHQTAVPKIHRQTQRGDIYDYEIDVDVANLVSVAKQRGGLQIKKNRDWLNNHVEAALLGFVKDIALNFADGKWTADVRLLGTEGFKFDIVPERALYSFSSPVLKQLEQKIPLCPGKVPSIRNK